jgi:hypothetical protein
MVPSLICHLDSLVCYYDHRGVILSAHSLELRPKIVPTALYIEGYMRSSSPDDFRLQIPSLEHLRPRGLDQLPILVPSKDPYGPYF